MIKKVQHGTSGDTIYHRVTLIIRLHNFIISLHNFSSGYAILVKGYKFRGCQFEIPGYTHTVGGRPAWSVILHECDKEDIAIDDTKFLKYFPYKSF